MTTASNTILWGWATICGEITCWGEVCTPLVPPAPPKHTLCCLLCQLFFRLAILQRKVRVIISSYWSKIATNSVWAIWLAKKVKFKKITSGIFPYLNWKDLKYRWVLNPFSLIRSDEQQPEEFACTHIMNIIEECKKIKIAQKNNKNGGWQHVSCFYHREIYGKSANTNP